MHYAEQRKSVYFDLSTLDYKFKSLLLIALYEYIYIYIYIYIYTHMIKLYVPQIYET